MPLTLIVNESVNVELGYNLPHVSPADPSVDPGPALSMPTDINGMLSTTFLLPPSKFAAATWHMLKDDGNMGSKFDFSDLPPLIPAIDHFCDHFITAYSS
jgi:hypothetical protein